MATTDPEQDNEDVNCDAFCLGSERFASSFQTPEKSFRIVIKVVSKKSTETGASKGVGELRRSKKQALKHR